MSDEPTVAVTPPHAEFCDWSLSNDPCNCGLDDFVAVMVAQARREGAEHEQAGWMKYEVERETSEVLRHRAVSIEQKVARLETAMLALSDEWTGQQSSGVKIHCGRRLRTALTTALRGDA